MQAKILDWVRSENWLNLDRRFWLKGVKFARKFDLAGLNLSCKFDARDRICDFARHRYAKIAVNLKLPPKTKSKGDFKFRASAKGQNLNKTNKISNASDDCQSPNLANPSAAKFARDYDKEPLIVKDYALCAVFILSSITLVFAFIVYFIFGDYEYSLVAWLYICIKYDLKTAAQSNFQARPCNTRLQIKSKSQFPLIK